MLRSLKVAGILVTVTAITLAVWVFCTVAMLWITFPHGSTPGD